MKYLDPPHIQLGFYWHNRPEAEKYCEILRWLVRNGFDMAPGALAMRSRGGVLPRYSQLATDNLDPEDVRMLPDWELSDVVSSTDWLPVLVELTSLAEPSLDIHLGYAFMAEPGVAAGAKRVIEIVASGANINLVQNVRPSNLPPAIVSQAAAAERVREHVFSGICGELEPDYAVDSEEWALQPPEALSESGDLAVAGRCYIAKTLVPLDAVCAVCASAQGLRITDSAQGVVVLRSGNTTPTALASSMRIARMIASELLETES